MLCVQHAGANEQAGKKVEKNFSDKITDYQYLKAML
jgi:hypothetical protein